MDRLRRADGAHRLLPAAGNRPRAKAPGEMTLLSVSGLSVRFGGLRAIEDLSFEVREGEVLSLIGPNGAGKTTAFNAITGYLLPSSGKIIFRGKEIGGVENPEGGGPGPGRPFPKTRPFGHPP